MNALIQPGRILAGRYRIDQQIGVGGIPNAVLAALGDHKHLGLHTEALTDGVVPLIRSGVIDNSQKKVLPGKNLALSLIHI